MHQELDPSGKSANQPGAKLDAGKPRPSLILSDMARALSAVIDVATFGAEKYSPRGWLQVENGQERYRDAADRHRLAIAKGETYDPQSKLLHKAHEAWNVLAELDLMSREQQPKPLFAVVEAIQGCYYQGSRSQADAQALIARRLADPNHPSIYAYRIVQVLDQIDDTEHMRAD